MIDANCFAPFLRFYTGKLFPVLALIALGSALLAQKASPNKITFSQGADNASLKGQLKGAEQAEYSLEIRGQREVTLQLKANPAGSIEVKLRDPDNKDIVLISRRQGRFTASLPNDGDYQVWVLRRKGNPRVSNYTLKLTVR